MTWTGSAFQWSPGSRRTSIGDHLLWHSRFGDVPRYATTANADGSVAVRDRAQAMAEQSASGIPLELIGLLTPLPPRWWTSPGLRSSGREAHAIGHAAVLLADRGVLLTGRHALRRPDPDARPSPTRSGSPRDETALDRLSEATEHANLVVPGHGAVAEGSEVAARLAADRAYIDALRRGVEPLDARLEQEWLAGPHQANLANAGIEH